MHVSHGERRQRAGQIQTCLRIGGVTEGWSEGGRARAHPPLLLTLAGAHFEKLGDVEPAADLLGLEGMDRRLAYKLASNRIVTREDLAEQAIVDLLDIEDIGQERAAALIMAARAPWFAAENAASATASAE